MEILIGFVLDCMAGDPYRLPHPVRLMGKVIGGLEKKLNRESDSPAAKMVKGLIEVVLVLLFSVVFPLIILLPLYRIHKVAGLVAEGILCYYMIAPKCLYKESMKVYACLKDDDLEGAKGAVSMIVGRDTKDLDREGVAKAAVETVAENTSDGVTSPLFYMAFLGATGGFIYKAVNTMDSMLGYKHIRYLYFGRPAARLDDFMNYLTARITALLMILAAFLTGFDGKGAFRIWKRDRRKHASPNSAQTESVCAGALGIRLAGDASYFGKVVEKPTIGDALRKIEPEDIRRANCLMYVTTMITVLLCTTIRLTLIYFGRSRLLLL